MTAGMSSPRGVVGITERRKAAQAIANKRDRLISAAIDSVARLAKDVELPDGPRDAHAIVATVEDMLPDLMRTLKDALAVGK